MNFKRIFVTMALILICIILTGCTETEAEGALRKLKRAMNEVVSIADELDMLYETDLDYERYESAIAIETGSIGNSTGSLPKPVESFLTVIADAKTAHQNIVDTRADLHAISIRIQMLINKIRNDELLMAKLDMTLISETIDQLNQHANDLTATIGQVVRVFNSKINPNLNQIVGNISTLLTTFETILTSLNSRILSLDGVIINLTAIEQSFIEVVNTDEN